jgi:CBS domain-containing protein
MSWIEWLQSRQLITASSEEMVSVAVDRMADLRIGALVVVDGVRLVGILSERDVIRRVLAERRDLETTPVGEVCTTDVKTVSTDSDIGECARLIKEHGFRHVPVVSASGAPMAIISSRDFLRFAVDELETLVARSYSKQRAAETIDPFTLLD